MGRVFENPTIRKPRVYTDRQKKYFAGKKDPERKRNVKHEEQLQIDLCDWIRLTLPDVHFRSDTGSGAFNSDYAKSTHNRQQSAKGLPDLEIFAARRGYHLLLLELKTKDAKLKRKKDATKLWVRKNGRGKVMEVDTHIRKAGEWYDPHIERQAKRIDELRADKYCAAFAIGLEHAKRIICWYFEIPYTPPPENVELF